MRNQEPIDPAPLSRALVYSASSASRSLLTHSLRSIGIEEVRYCSKIVELRSTLENRSFDLVLLDEHDRHEAPHLTLEEIRRSGLLDIRTIVIIVSGAPTHQSVVEAAESGVDIYLARPFSLAALIVRLENTLTRRDAMRDVYEALARQDWDTALESCLERYQYQRPFWLYAARIAAEILLMKRDHTQAQSLYEAILQHEALPWAKLGVARALIERGQIDRAAQLAEEAASDDNADAYDVLGRAHMEAGRYEEALASFALGMRASPKSTGRLHRLGLMQMLCGDVRAAAQSLRDAVRYGIGSRSFEPLSLFWLLCMYQRVGTHADFKWLRQQLGAALRAGYDADFIHDVQHIDTLWSELRASQMPAGKLGEFNSELLERAAQDLSQPTYTFDRACVTMAAAATALRQHWVLDYTVVERVAQRFAFHPLACSWLVYATQGNERIRETVEHAYEATLARAREIAQGVVGEQVDATFAELLAYAQNCLNSRVIDMTDKLLQRHRARLKDESLMMQMQHLLECFGIEQAKRLPGFRHLRHPGGLALLARASSKPQTAQAAEVTA